jgi:hypothetical protein
MAKPNPGLNALQQAILRAAARRPPGSAVPMPRATAPTPAAHPAGAKPALFRWPTDPAGKKPAHTVTWAKHQVNAAPIVPGSSINNKTLGRQSRAAVTEKYGPAETAGRQAVTDATRHQGDLAGPGGFYDQYLAQLAEHKKNVDAANTAAQGQVANLGNITGPQVASTGDQANAGDEKNAAAVRSALLGALQGALVGQGAAASTYADTLAHVVGPGQKLTATENAGREITKAKGSLADLKREEGAYRTDFEDTARQNETKNVLSAQALGLDAAKIAATSADKAAGRRAAARKENQSLITSGPFAGLTHQQVRSMNPTDKQTLKDASKAPEKTITSGPFAGYTQSQIGRHSQTWVQRRLDAYQRGGGGKPTDQATQYAKDFYRQYGVKPASTSAISSAGDTLAQAKSTIRQIRQSNPGMTRQQLGAALLTGQAAVKDDPSTKGNEASSAIPKIRGLWVTVALDLAYNGYVSKVTADRLHKSGFLASQFDLPTKPPALPKAPKAPAPLTTNPLTGAANPLMP